MAEPYTMPQDQDILDALRRHNLPIETAKGLIVVPQDMTGMSPQGQGVQGYAEP